MITLGQTDTFQGMASIISGISYTLFGAELSLSVETYKVLAQGQLPLFTAPLYTTPASTSTFIKRMEFTNFTTGDITGINLFINGSGNSNRIKSSFTIKSFYSMSFDGDGWQTYDNNGNALVLGGIIAAGQDKQIQFNDGGTSLGTDPDLTWDKVNNTLGINGTDAEIVMKGVTNEPSAPSQGSTTFYARSIAGRTIGKMRTPFGIDTAIQPAIFGNNIVLFNPGAAAGLYQGTVGTNLGTAAIVLPTTTNNYTMLRRSTFSSLITTTGQQIGVRTENMFCRGNATELGGFFYAARFGFTSIKTGCRFFAGLCVDAAAIVTFDASSRLNLCGFGMDLSDTGVFFMHNDAAGVATKENITGNYAFLTNNTAYDAFIYAAPNDTTVYFRLDRIDNGAPVTLIDSSVTSDLPVNTTLLTAQVAVSNGTNIVANDAVVGVNRMYVETDR